MWPRQKVKQKKFFFSLRFIVILFCFIMPFILVDVAPCWMDGMCLSTTTSIPIKCNSLILLKLKRTQLPSESPYYISLHSPHHKSQPLCTMRRSFSTTLVHRVALCVSMCHRRVGACVSAVADKQILEHFIMSRSSVEFLHWPWMLSQCICATYECVRIL